MSLVLAALSVFGAAWLALCIWTARKLLVGAGGAERKGVLGWGVPMWLTWSVWMTYDEVGGALLSSAGLWGLCTRVVIGFPLFLWGGHFFGAGMARVFPQPPTRQPGREGEG